MLEWQASLFMMVKTGAWWQMTFASVALFGIVLAFQIFGDSLRDALDPRLRH